MASSDPEIRDGFTLPVWMKTKPTKDFEPFAASPPAPEDSFFYIKYPKTDQFFAKNNVNKIEQDIQKVLQEPKVVTAASYVAKEKDWSKHTKPCQDVLHSIASAPNFSALSANGVKKSPADEDFKEETSACGTSVVKVASQMISRSPRGFTLASPSEEDLSPSGISSATAAVAARGRRGSRSLPASPVHTPPHSPRTARKSGNRYFTSPFEPVESKSWLSGALLACKRQLAASANTLLEEDDLQARLQGATLAESVENLGPAPQSIDAKSMPAPPKEPVPSKTSGRTTLRPKPTELREMNFWSPTSM